MHKTALMEAKQNMFPVFYKFFQAARTFQRESETDFMTNEGKLPKNNKE